MTVIINLRTNGGSLTPLTSAKRHLIRSPLLFIGQYLACNEMGFNFIIVVLYEVISYLLMSFIINVNGKF